MRVPAGLIETWFCLNKRDLPWRHERNAYRVWLAEIMLQQTQVTTVIDYFNRFLHRFKTVHDLAGAPEDEVLSLWSGLGYYSRCRNLHRCAQIVVEQHGGIFPDDYNALLALPGIGSYTAGAILAFAFNKPAPVVDGNIARVLARLFNDETEWNTPSGKRHFEAISLDLLESASCISDWQEGLMEVGATICKPKNPQCVHCPLQNHCLAYCSGTVETLPKKAKKSARSSLQIVCAVIHDDNNVWLEKNNDKRLFKGLYAPPSEEVKDPSQLDNALERILSARQISCSHKPMHPIVVKRTLTHRDMTLYGFLISLKDFNATHDAPLVHKEQLRQIGLSTAIRTLLHRTLPHTWSGNLLQEATSLATQRDLL